MRILAIDPGPTESAWVEYDLGIGHGGGAHPVTWDKAANHEVLDWVENSVDRNDSLAIEMVASYGMSVGAEVFETCVAIGRCAERWSLFSGGKEPRYVYRREVKLHVCGDSRAKDANIRQALIDRYGGKDTAIGKKKTPGPLYGVSGDVWSALAVAVTAAETEPSS